MSKDFNEFKSQFEEIHFKQIAGIINELKISSPIPNNEENMNKFIESVGAMSIAITFELLDAYHNWHSRK